MLKIGHLLLYEKFYINLFSPFKAGIQKASLKTRNSITTLQLTLKAQLFLQVF